MGSRVVTKEWHVRLQICVFTLPVGSIVTVEREDPFCNKVLVRFSDKDIEWISTWELDRYTSPIVPA